MFSFWTSDDASKSIKTFCKENELSHNIFLNNLIDDFLGNQFLNKRLWKKI